MIGIQLQGQLGNQLFQIAFIRRSSKILHELYAIIEDKSYGCLAENYFTLRFYERRYFRKILKYLFFLMPRKILEFNNWQESEVVLDFLETGVIYKGFFQSDYFLDKVNRANLFRIKKRYERIFYNKYGDLFKRHKVAVIHIRLKDYLEIGTEELGGKGLQLPLDYYQKALEQAEIDDNTKILVVSDDIQYVKQNLKLSKPFSIEENHFIIDFLLLMNANSLIISNSTFSWWGAFLNTRQDLKVIAPEYWLGFKIQKTYPVDIICDSWSTVPVINN
jgi:hypothetical protein